MSDEPRTPPNYRKVVCCASCRHFEGARHYADAKCREYPDTKASEAGVCDDHKPWQTVSVA